MKQAFKDWLEEATASKFDKRHGAHSAPKPSGSGARLSHHLAQRLSGAKVFHLSGASFDPSLKHKAWVGLRLILFTVVGFMLLSGITVFAMPYWTDNLLTDKIRAFYAEPANSIDVLFLGTSSVANGISPMVMYDQEGVSAYNLGMSDQPTASAYCWAKEAQRLHPQSLKTVVFDCSALRNEPDPAHYQMTLDPMELPSKVESVIELSKDPGEAFSYFFPLLSYHDRWAELSESDVEQATYPNHSFLRGYVPSTARGITDGWTYKLAAPPYAVDEHVRPITLIPSELEAFDKLATFCRDHDLNLVLIKIPCNDWSSAEHLAVSNVAKSYDLPFLDYNFDPYLSEIDYNQALDSRDNYHLNDYGATKLSSSLATYLVEHSLASDVRGNPTYSYLEERNRDYLAVTSDLTELRYLDDPAVYVGQAVRTDDAYDFTVYIAATSDGLDLLSPEQKQAFANMGLPRFASLLNDYNYYCVVQDGQVVDEDAGSNETYGLYTSYNEAHRVLPKESYYQLFPRTDERAQQAEQWAEGTLDSQWAPEWTQAVPGITVILYDNDRHFISDIAKFRADIGLRRFGDPQTALETEFAAGKALWQMPYCLWRLNVYEENCNTARQHALGIQGWASDADAAPSVGPNETSPPSANESPSEISQEAVSMENIG